jgi:FixJ family two-component response regulator
VRASSLNKFGSFWIADCNNAVMSAHAEATVYIVDADHAFCDRLRRSLASAGRRVAAFADAETFLAACDPQQTGCIVLETLLAGITGLELQSELRQRAIYLPVIFVTAHGDVPSAVAALRNGAAEFLEKPVGEQTLLGVIEKALKLDAARRREHARKKMVAACLEKLTAREREIMRYVIAGKMNKTIADELCISIKTVEAHRARVMQKVGVDSIAALVQLALEIDHPRIVH